MKKNKRWIKLFLVSVLIVSFLCGCGASRGDMSSSAEHDYAYKGDRNGNFLSMGTTQYDESADTTQESYDYAEEAAPEETTVAQDAGTGGDTSLEDTVASNRKLIREVHVSMETQEFDVLTVYIEKRVAELGGYMESSDISGKSYGSSRLRDAYYTVRVPVDKMDLLLNDVSEKGNIINKNESAKDVTLSYVDTKSRKEAYEVEYDRLFELLQKAEDIDTIVALESRLTTVRYEIQSLESQLRTYDNLVDFATVHINVSEVAVYTPVEPEEKSDLKRMVEGFVHSIVSIGYDIKEFVIDFVIVLPYLVIWALIIWVIVMIIRKWNKKRKIKKEKRNAERLAKANENRVCDADRKTECGKVNINEPANRTEDSNHVKQTADNKK